jgi:GNAT superfamily N-acetyltransferase
MPSTITKSEIQFRFALIQDLPAIVQMLTDDPLGSKREQFTSPLPTSYQLAFAAIEADPNNELIVAVSQAEIIGVLQITFIPYLTYQGGWRALIEGVRVSRNFRASGIGHALFEWAINRAKQRGCVLVQLTTDKSRPEALRFYEKLGFVASHEGMKLKL